MRENQDGILVAMNYGRTSALRIDPIEKKPLYHFMPNTWTYSLCTVGCNMHCEWCQNASISQQSKPNRQILGDYITPEVHVKNALRLNCPSISFTYTEPTIFFEYAFDIMRLAKEHDLNTVWVTNGYMSNEVLDEILPLLDAANVDYKGSEQRIYETYCGGTSQPILNNIRRMVDAGVHVEVTTLIVPGVNDESAQLRQIATDIAAIDPAIPWHISRFFPAHHMKDTPKTPYETLRLAERFGREAGLETIHLGNV